MSVDRPCARLTVQASAAVALAALVCASLSEAAGQGDSDEG